MLLASTGAAANVEGKTLALVHSMQPNAHLPTPAGERLHQHFAKHLSMGAHNGHENALDEYVGLLARASLTDDPQALAALQNLAHGAGGLGYHPSHVANALRAAFRQTDDELAGV